MASELQTCGVCNKTGQEGMAPAKGDGRLTCKKCRTTCYECKIHSNIDLEMFRDVCLCTGCMPGKGCIRCSSGRDLIRDENGLYTCGKCRPMCTQCLETKAVRKGLCNACDNTNFMANLLGKPAKRKRLDAAAASSEPKATRTTETKCRHCKKTGKIGMMIVEGEKLESCAECRATCAECDEVFVDEILPVYDGGCRFCEKCMPTKFAPCETCKKNCPVITGCEECSAKSVRFNKLPTCDQVNAEIKNAAEKALMDKFMASLNAPTLKTRHDIDGVDVLSAGVVGFLATLKEAGYKWARWGSNGRMQLIINTVDPRFNGFGDCVMFSDLKPILHDFDVNGFDRKGSDGRVQIINLLAPME
jgi:hypothetical protein